MGRLSPWNRFRYSFSKVHLVDKCLIVFMVILMLQSAYVLFVPLAEGSGAANIDIVVRTSAAGIFGYFLSANFISRASLGEGKRTEKKAVRQVMSETSPAPQTPRSQVGFSAEEPQLTSGGVKTATEPKVEEPPLPPESQLQILIAAGMGIFSLVVLLIIRDISSHLGVSHSTSAIATTAQLRDFVSGCVGFLIGCPTAKKVGEK